MTENLFTLPTILPIIQFLNIFHNIWCLTCISSTWGDRIGEEHVSQKDRDMVSRECMKDGHICLLQASLVITAEIFLFKLLFIREFLSSPNCKMCLILLVNPPSVKIPARVLENRAPPQNKLSIPSP